MHSKGPWTIKRGQWQGDDEFDVMSADQPPELLAVNVSRADGALIAAAPEMLSALEEVNKYIRGRCVGGELSRSVFEQLDAAIAKAKGE